MIYMLDTNICSFIIRNKPKSVKEKLKEVEREHRVVLSTIVVSELLYGAYKKGSPKLINVVQKFIECFEIIPYDYEASKVYGKLRAELEKQGISIGAYDLQIAAHALSIDAILVTNNLREFGKIKGLKVEDWLDVQNSNSDK